jgi:DNA-binding NtrC family response regulator
MVGASPAMKALQANIDFVARSSAPALIVGETGVGKELVARAIHVRSERHDRAFVPVNTSAIPRELLESEIFGHVRGGFTGALHPRRGLLTEADGGTLLLDEIGDMPCELQSKLLRVLQSGEVRAVGSDRAHHVDVRILASTHRDLPALVEQGRFREDLFFRLDVLPVFVPPLRERSEDIPALVAHFLEGACRRAPQSPVRRMDEGALRILVSSPWPGNVRQLENAIERMVVFGVDEVIAAEQVARVTSPTAAPAWPCASDAPWTLHRLSVEYMDWVLAKTGGNKQRAVALLGINLSTLYRWQRARGE